MKDEKRDPYDIKKFQEVLAESQMMIPDSICRRDKALGDLREFVTTLESDVVGSDFEWMLEAKKILGGTTTGDANKGDYEDDVAVTAVDDLAEGEAF